jgi:uncharacterized repeat protein (TIGR01451 family)
MRLASLEKICSCAFKLGMWACLLMIAPQLGWAAGTPSGTTISNTASLTYAIGAGPVTIASSNTVSFTVDSKINLLVAGGVITNVSAGQTGVLTPFTVTNTSNVTLNFLLTAQNNSSGIYTVNSTFVTDNFDPMTALTIYRDNNCNGAIDGADAAVTSIQDLAPGPTVCLLVQTDIPAARVNGDAMVISFKAQAAWPTTLIPAEEPPVGGGAGQMAGSNLPVTASAGANTAGIDVVLADAAGVAADIASDGYHSTYGAFSVSGVNVALIKTVTSVVDPSGGPVKMPGAVMTYQIAVAVSGSGIATNLVITDPLPAQTSYVVGSIILDGAPQTDPIDPPTDNTDFGFTTANAVTVKLGNVTSPANHVITFKATIN